MSPPPCRLARRRSPIARVIRTELRALLAAGASVLVSCAPADPPGATAVGWSAGPGAGTPHYAVVSGERRAARPGDVDVDELPGGAIVREWLARDPAAKIVVGRSSRRVVHAAGRLSAASSAPDEDILRSFLRRSASVLDLADPDSELALEHGPVAFLGFRAYRLRQVKNGVPILRRSVKIAIGGDGSVRTMSGSTSSDVGALPGLEPDVSQPRAVALAQEMLRSARPAASVADTMPPRLMILPGSGARPAHLAWRVGMLALEPDGRGQAPHAWLATLDAHDAAPLGMTDTTRGCTDGQSGTVVTSSELVRTSIHGESAPVPRDIDTCYSDSLDAYFLEDHRTDAALLCYDAAGNTDPAAATAWYSACPEPVCSPFSNPTNDWTSGAPAQRASDFRNAQKVLSLFQERFGRVGADGHGENLILATGMSFDNARAMGMFRAIALGGPDEASGRPSWGVLDVLAHEFTHIVSWHEWVGFFDYGVEGAMTGAERSVDEHLADMFGAIALDHDADEPWVAGVRWAHAAEHEYRKNYLARGLLHFKTTVDAQRNYYTATNGATTCGHVSQIVADGSDDAAYTNAILLGRAVYLFTEGGFVDQDSYGWRLAGWPPDAPSFHVDGIGMDRTEKILYHSLVTGEFATAAGYTSYGDVAQVEGDAGAVKAELEKVAHIQLASCLEVSAQEGWPEDVCASVRAAYVGVGLLAALPAGTGEPCEADDNGAPCTTGRCVDGVCQGGDQEPQDEPLAVRGGASCGCTSVGRGPLSGFGWMAAAAGLGLAALSLRVKRSASASARMPCRRRPAGQRRPWPGSSPG